MNIIICGAGRVGYTIAKLLSEQDHSITVIDQSSEDIQKINEDLDVKSIVGKATYPSVLENPILEIELQIDKKSKEKLLLELKKIKIYLKSIILKK